MFIFKSNQKRANHNATYESADGTRYPRIPAELLDEIPEPAPPADYSDELYYRTEQEDAPYVIYTRKSDEQLQQIADSKAKQDAKHHLEATDYLFNVDRQANLLANDPQREADLRNSRELARQVLRDYIVKYPQP